MTEGELKDMLVLVRNTKGGPPHCSCSDCERKRESEKVSLALSTSELSYFKVVVKDSQ